MIRFIDRRTFLRGAGGVAIGLPLLNAMGCLSPRGREGQSKRALTGPPKRLVVFFSPNGTIANTWQPTGTETSFTLPPILTPLAPYQKDLLVLWGIDATSARNGPGDDHEKGISHILTGTEMVSGGSGNVGGGISVDQAIAKQVGSATKFASLEFGVQVNDSSSHGRMIFAGANQPLPPMESPSGAFSRVFSALVKPSSGPDPNVLREKTVLDSVMQDYQSLMPKLGTEDRQKLDAHLSALRDIESHLATGAQIGGACQPPTVGGASDFVSTGKTMLDLLAMSLACDLTRVASIQWTRSTSDEVFSWLSAGIVDGHHTLSHRSDSDATSQTQLTAINNWYAQQLAYLIGKLKAMPEGAGSVFDNTVIVWVNELGKGNTHSHIDNPFVLAGSCGGHFRTGRYLQYSPDVPHNNLLVSLMNAMGVPATTFGNPAYCTGPLANLT